MEQSNPKKLTPFKRSIWVQSSYLSGVDRLTVDRRESGRLSKEDKMIKRIRDFVAKEQPTNSFSARLRMEEHKRLQHFIKMAGIGGWIRRAV